VLGFLVRNGGQRIPAHPGTAGMPARVHFRSVGAISRSADAPRQPADPPIRPLPLRSGLLGDARPASAP
jgi:hypothetical protein